MKRLLILTFFILSVHFMFGQACGIYRIEYVGDFASINKEIVTVYLPTTMFLHGLENEKSDLAFVDTNLTEGLLQIEIRSHLTIPYNNIDQLISFYRSQSDMFPMKISYIENGAVKETKIEIDWKKIEVTIIEDGKFGTLFRFKIKEISI
jgi:hypothetical protein